MSNGTSTADHLDFLRAVSNDNLVPRSRFTAATSKKANRKHKSSRQLLADESKRINAVLQRDAQNPEAPKPTVKVTYFSVNAPPSLRPAKRYCDITGLRGYYKSPVNRLRYHNAEIYQLVVKPMAPGVDQEYLKLRGDNFVLK
ncbi:hypothetical protein HG535_0E04630 [Zygotorulaspora mrakii]|uniref:Vps72/YL1 C-terminal domain-containing protein n=1 Tax=Zygotorulaspora mrakii TaxID=42260 RepID=A0A7H9B5Y2_ZYGMR|nr:uncharacterized protein HG535_0E04630 [Zygotorulaspora mrakii]QLG73379.1 hypothetical protein HG535_0E04630 [Zygotorulaspora mrakii]